MLLFAVTGLPSPLKEHPPPTAGYAWCMGITALLCFLMYGWFLWYARTVYRKEERSKR